MTQPEKNKKSDKRKYAILIGIFLALFVFIIGSFLFYNSLYSNKIYPNVLIGDIDVGGMEKSQAQEVLNYKINAIQNKDINIHYNEKNWVIDPVDFSLNYNLPETIQAVYEIGRKDSIFSNSFNKIKLLFVPTKVKMSFSYDKNKFDDLFTKIAQEVNKNEIDASCQIVDEQVVLNSEQIGQEIRLPDLKNNFIDLIAYLNEDRVLDLPINEIEPKIKIEDVNFAKNQAEIILGQKVYLKNEAKDTEITKSDISKWIEFIAYFDNSSNNYKLKTVLNEEKIKFYIYNLAKNINQNPKDAKLTISDGKVSVFQLSQDGYKLNQEETLSLIVNALYSNVAGFSTDEGNLDLTKDIDLPVDIKKPEISADNLDDLGIKTKISTATTSFVKSPNNRKHNIKIGADIFHGVLIKPDEVFSFNKTLGRVSAAQGFLPELVIKEDRTEPELGGGLCQVSTTIFRTALNAGLPVTERTNHKYRVSYYEPPVGLDATIYLPSPDLKFKNNTGKYILVQSSVSGSSITFDFYGTLDGRTVSISDPELYDHTSPGPTRYIDNPNMAPGSEKYLEKAHPGVKAKIHYQVKKNDQVMHEQTFYSHYKAWSAVIERGPEQEQNSEGEENQEENHEENQDQ